ncbi:hypothetical protein ACFY0N_00745 [Streptomyces vinaceus]|uniref:hypothetical protein n=1 Tax=Streptomyces vinaceus TaxID=1960 RepID=UPI00367C84E6
MTTEGPRDLNPAMLDGLHGLKHRRFVPASMRRGLAHFGYARPVEGTGHEITEAGIAYLHQTGTCRKTTTLQLPDLDSRPTPSEESIR